MVDNVAITAGVGTTIAADDVGGALHQRVKISVGADGSAADMTAGSGVIAASTPRMCLATDSPGVVTQRTTAQTMSAGYTLVGWPTDNALPAGEIHLGEIGGRSVVKTIAMSTDTSAYASGDLIADTQQLAAAFRKTDGTGVLNTLTIIDQDAQGVAFYVLLHYTTTSMGTENSAPNISDANLASGLQGVIAVATTDYVTVSGAKVACIKNIGLPLKAVSGTDNLYISVLNATGTPTYTATGLNLALGILLD